MHGNNINLDFFLKMKFKEDIYWRIKKCYYNADIKNTSFFLNFSVRCFLRNIFSGPWAYPAFGVIKPSVFLDLSPQISMQFQLILSQMNLFKQNELIALLR